MFLHLFPVFHCILLWSLFVPGVYGFTVANPPDSISLWHSIIKSAPSEVVSLCDVFLNKADPTVTVTKTTTLSDPSTFTTATTQTTDVEVDVTTTSSYTVEQTFTTTVLTDGGTITTTEAYGFQVSKLT